MADIEQGPGGGWTEEEISRRLGISTAVFPRGRPIGARQIATIRQAGISLVEITRLGPPGGRCTFDYRDRQQVSVVKTACSDQGVRVVSFHMPVGDAELPLQSASETERERGVDQLVAIADLLMEMGGEVLVGHLEPDEMTKRSIEDLLKRFENLPVVIAVENVGQVSIDDVISFVDEFASAHLRMVLDIGHERDSSGVNPLTDRLVAAETVERCGDRLHHVHLHETFPTENRPDHQPPLHPDGIIEWGEIFGGLGRIGYKGALMFEDGRGEDPDEWIRMTGTFPQRFMERYRS